MARRIRGLAVLCVLATALLPAGALATTRSYATSLESSVLQELNQIRIAHGLVPLVLSRQLTAAADAHSLDMLSNGYFAHASFDGTSFSERIARYYPPGSSLWSVGENLLWTAGRIDAASSLAAWMADPGHRANILSPAWRQIGIAAASSNDAPGVYGGGAVTVITTDFGVRSDQNAPSAPPAAPSPGPSAPAPPPLLESA